MEDKYDVCVLGTGLTECILSGLLSVSGWKVLHLDKNDYYGGENASLNIEQLYEKFEGKESKPPKEFGKPRDWNVDLIPKFVMANGLLMKLLQSCGITNLDFTLVEGSYVVIKDKIQKVPSNVTEVANSPLMSFWEKNRCRKFLMYVLAYKKEDKNTHGGYNLMKMKMKELYNAYGLVEDTIDFLGHAVALYTNDNYLEQAAEPTVYRLKLYYESLGMYGKSPYVYPLYGLGELPQVFARLCAVYGGVYMLNKPIDKIHYDEDGKFKGVESENEVAKVPIIVGDPTYFKEKTKKVGSFIRAICILSSPVANTNDSKSCQIIIPQKQTKRKSDIYISVVSSAHHVCLKGKYLAIIQTEQETNDVKKELSFALDLVGKADKVFINVTDNLVPTSNGKNDNVFISKSVDTTCHFETVVDDVLDLYYRITGSHFDFTKSKEQRDKEILAKREKEEKEKEEKEKEEKKEEKKE